jgi:hypothetical protein
MRQGGKGQDALPSVDIDSSSGMNAATNLLFLGPALVLEPIVLVTHFVGLSPQCDPK